MSVICRMPRSSKPAARSFSWSARAIGVAQGLGDEAMRGHDLRGAVGRRMHGLGVFLGVKRVLLFHGVNELLASFAQRNGLDPSHTQNINEAARRQPERSNRFVIIFIEFLFARGAIV